MLSDIPWSPPKPSPAGLLSDMPLRLLSDFGGTDGLVLGAGDGVAVFDASCLGLSAGTELPLPTLANDIPELLRILARSLLTADSGVGFSCGTGLGVDFNMVNLEPLGRLTLAGAGCAGEEEAATAGEDERDTEVPDSLLSLLSLEDTAADEGDDVSAFSGGCLAPACDRPMEMLVLAASLDGRLAAGAGAGAVTGAGVVLEIKQSNN